MPDAYLLNEKRVAPRITVKIPITFRVINDRGKIESLRDRDEKGKNSHTLDISLGGMFILAGQTLKGGNILSLVILIPGSKKKLKAFAEVVWTNEMGGGVRFLAMKENDMKSFKAYLDMAYPSK